MMRVLIVENEMYLAQSIASKLGDAGYSCELAASTKDALKDEHFDVVLLSPAISGQNFMPIVEKYKKSIIILMVSYVDNDTVSIPMRAGAKDYILKPFMMEELVKKITHYALFEQQSSENDAFRRYISSLQNDVASALEINKKVRLPLLVECKDRQTVDAFVFRLAAAKNLAFAFVDLTSPAALMRIREQPSKTLLYAYGLEALKRADKKIALDALSDKNAIIVSLDDVEETDIPKMQLSVGERAFCNAEIVTTEEYVKSVIINFQDRYPDVELAKRLGISRKSLWEKRKKYDIFKRK